MKSTSRVHQYRADHAHFISLWQKGIPTVEIAYCLGLSKAQLEKHLAEVVEDELERPKPAYEVILVEELPRCLRRHPAFSDVPMGKVESCGEGFVLTPYDPESVEQDESDETSEATAEVQD